MILEDTEFTSSRMNGASFMSGKYAGSMRRFLMREHLGMLKDADVVASNEAVADCVTDTFYKDVWLKTASINTKIFDEAFLVVPTDEVTTLEKCHKYEQKRPLAEFDRIEARRILGQVKVRKTRNQIECLVNDCIIKN